MASSKNSVLNLKEVKTKLRYKIMKLQQTLGVAETLGYAHNKRTATSNLLKRVASDYFNNHINVERFGFE